MDSGTNQFTKICIIEKFDLISIIDIIYFKIIKSWQIHTKYFLFYFVECDKNYNNLISL